MFRFGRRRTHRGLPPGSLVGGSGSDLAPVAFERIEYDSADSTRRDCSDAVDSLVDPPETGVAWVNIVGVHDAAVMETIRERLGVHPLVLEDVMNVGQRPAVEEGDDHVFVVLHMLTYDADTRSIESEQVSFLVFDRLVLTFQEHAGDVFDPVRERIAAGKGQVRARGADYLAYALMDVVVDHYFAVLESIGEDLESIEERLMRQPSSDMLARIYELRREMLALRRSVWPLRDVVFRLERDGAPVFAEATIAYLRDLHSHVIEVIDMAEQSRELLSSLLDLYLSSVGNRMNSVMQTLTVIATIFIPITFIAGIYGMNFDDMPELHWEYGYPMALGLMAATAVGTYVYMRFHKWF